MRLTHIRAADLNLLLPALVLLEERQVSKAADRYHLSQPAMSRALQRLRDMFGDELLVRTRDGFEPTMRGRHVLQELSEVLPRLDALLRGGRFDPGSAHDEFRIAGTDYAITVLGPCLFRRIFQEAPGVSLDVVSWRDTSFEDLERGRLDLVLWPNEVPDALCSEPLFEDDFVCLVSSDHPTGAGPIALRDYLRAPHVVVSVLEGSQTLVERRLLEVANSRRVVGLRVPYFAGAVAAIAHTPLILTVPRRFAELYRDRPDLRTVEAPRELGRITYLMSWHPRTDSDVASQWLRAVIRTTADAVNGECGTQAQ